MYDFDYSSDTAFSMDAYEAEVDAIAELEEQIYDRNLEIRNAFVEFLSTLICDDAEKAIYYLDDVIPSVVDFLKEKHDIPTIVPHIDYDEDTGCAIVKMGPVDSEDWAYD